MIVILSYTALYPGILIPSSCVSDLKQTLTRIAEQAAGLGTENTGTQPSTISLRMMHKFISDQHAIYHCVKMNGSLADAHTNTQW